MAQEPDITLLLDQLRNGDSAASEAIIPLLYEELRAIAARCLRSERRGHTLQPTALVHEAFLKLVDQKEADYRSRGHFMAIAAMVMRRILVSHAEKRAAAKRGGGAARVPFDDELGAQGAYPVWYLGFHGDRNHIGLDLYLKAAKGGGQTPSVTLRKAESG